MPAQCPRRINEARSVNLYFTGRRAGPPQARPDPLGGSIAVLGDRGVVMSELHKFLFQGLPVRGMLVRLTDGWRELLSRRDGEAAYPPPVRTLLGEMAAAG